MHRHGYQLVVKYAAGKGVGNGGGRYAKFVQKRGYMYEK